MKNRALFLITLSSVLLASCSWWSTKVELGRISDCQKDYEDKRITVEGYFGVNRDEGLVICEAGDKYRFCLLAFTPEPKAKTRLDVIVPLGYEANQMESPVSSGQRLQIIDENNLDEMTERLRIRASDGTVINGLRRVRITGKAGSCDIRVEKIEYP